MSTIKYRRGRLSVASNPVRLTDPKTIDLKCSTKADIPRTVYTERHLH